MFPSPYSPHHPPHHLQAPYCSFTANRWPFGAVPTLLFSSPPPPPPVTYLSDKLRTHLTAPGLGVATPSISDKFDPNGVYGGPNHPTTSKDKRQSVKRSMPDELDPQDLDSEPTRPSVCKHKGKFWTDMFPYPAADRAEIELMLSNLEDKSGGLGAIKMPKYWSDLFMEYASGALDTDEGQW